jgi:hypothetical protein
MYNYKVEITGEHTEIKVFTTKKQALDCFAYYEGFYDIKVFQGAYTQSTTDGIVPVKWYPPCQVLFHSFGREYLIKRGYIFDNEPVYEYGCFQGEH